MAEEKKVKRSSSLARLTPNSINLSVDGQDIRVATDKQENAILNMVMASQLRSLLQEQIKAYKDKDAVLTPKELRELAAAGRDIASFSAEVYAGTDQIDDPKEKNVTKSADIEFDEPTGDTSEVDSGGHGEAAPDEQGVAGEP